MREVMSLHVGQCGVQLGHSLWDRYRLEHGVGLDGKADPDACDTPGFSSFFTEKEGGHHNPNAVFVDLETLNADLLTKGKSEGFYNPDQIYSWNEDAANLFPRGYYISEKNVLLPVCDRFRLFLEGFDSFQGSMLMRSIGGGTGSGFASLLLDWMTDELGNKPVISWDLYPSKESGVVEPYNALLSTQSSTKRVDCCMVLDNEALGRVYTGTAERTNFSHINSLVAQAISSVTAGIRFEGSLNVDMDAFQNNLVPFPKIRFSFVSYAPLHQKCGTVRQSVQSLTRSCFESTNRICSVPAETGQYVAVCLLYSGNVVHKDVISAVSLLKESGLAKFVSWSPGIRIGINNRSLKYNTTAELQSTDISLGCVANSSATSVYWAALNKRFDLMYRKRAFLHWFHIEGTEDHEFKEAREATGSIETEYRQLADPVDDL